MAEIVVNGRPMSLESGPKTWRDALAVVERDADARQEAVTAVRFAGVDQPSFRGVELADTLLAAIGLVECETVPRTRLLRTTLGTASLSLPTVAAGACQAATRFRRGDLDDGHCQLSDVLATIHTLVELTVATAAAAGADLNRLACGADTAAGVLGAVGVVLDQLAESQRAADWIAVADGLEYDLAPALLQWGVVFDAIDDRCAA